MKIQQFSPISLECLKKKNGGKGAKDDVTLWREQIRQDVSTCAARIPCLHCEPSEFSLLAPGVGQYQAAPAAVPA